MTISILDIISSTSVDGPGLRTTIYSAGCSHRCKGCHNPSSWDIDSGKRVSTDEVVDTVISHEFENVTFSGGDPLYQVEGFIDIAKKIKTKSTKNIWCYTGYRFEDLLLNEKAKELLKYVDVVVDGRYCDEQRDGSLLFRGSRNQRIIDVQKSLSVMEIVELKMTTLSKYLL